MSVITIEVSPDVTASKRFGPLVQTASEWLRESLPILEDPVRAEWTWVDNSPGEEMVALTLKDELSSMTRLFRKMHLEDRAEAEHEFNGLIRSLLRHRTHYLVKKLQESGVASGE